MQITVPGLTHSAILDTSPIPTSVIDAEGTVVYVNDAFLAYASKVWGTKIRSEDRIGRNVREFITGRGDYDRQEWLKIYDRVLKKGETVFLQEFCGRPLPDREVHVDVRMNPIKGEDGQVLAAVLTWQDVTDRVNAQREERRRSALDRMRASVLSMQTPEDIEGVLIELHRQLKPACCRQGSRYTVR